MYREMSRIDMSMSRIRVERDFFDPDPFKFIGIRADPITTSLKS